MRNYINNLLKKASRSFLTETPTSLRGQELAALLRNRALHKLTNQQVTQVIEELETYLNIVFQEQLQHNARVFAGIVLKENHPNSFVLDVLAEDQFLSDVVNTGENYEIPQ